MLSIHEIHELPRNFDAFVEENARGLRRLYGRAAEAEYRDSVAGRLDTALRHDAVRAVAACQGEDAFGLLLSSTADGFGRIHFLHVLDGQGGHGIEGAIIREAVDHFEQSGVDGIAAEYLAFCPLCDGPAFDELGFAMRERAVMVAPLPLRCEAATCDIAIRPATLLDRARIARTIIASYRGHPSRVLHPEVRSEARAVAFVRAAMNGAYGPTDRRFTLIAGGAKTPEGVVIGCRVAPDVGFVLHLAVRPDAQNCGIGSALLYAASREFERAGLRKIALGVTWDNPARRLYERMGFEPRHRLCGRAWWRDPATFAELLR